MPVQIETDDVWEKNGSILKLNPAEELFLSYSDVLTSGPGIVRNGIGPPWMEVLDKIGKTTTDPHEQRWLSWFIDTASKKKAKKFWADQDKGTEHWTLNEWRRHISQLPVHTQEFRRSCQGARKQYAIVGQQGAGDLTMNEWCVAFVNSIQSQNTSVLICLSDEPLTHRRYTCLVKWRDARKRVTVEEDVRFSRVPFPQVQINDESASNDVEFAVFGKQVIANGEVVDLIDVVDQFSDLRHLVKLPNLNPNREIDMESSSHSAHPKIIAMFADYPRLFFGEMKTYDVWLGEAQLLAGRNLRRAALKIPILLNLLFEGLGTPRELTRAVMWGQDYQELPENDFVRLKGQWRFLPKDVTKSGDWIEVRLKDNGYPCTMIGVDNYGNNTYMLAYNGGYGDKTGAKSIKEVAQDFIDFTDKAGHRVHRAMMFDEGGDVFQKADLGAGLQETVPMKREQLRCCFIVGKEL